MLRIIVTIGVPLPPSLPSSVILFPEATSSAALLPALANHRCPQPMPTMTMTKTKTMMPHPPRHPDCHVITPRHHIRVVSGPTGRWADAKEMPKPPPLPLLLSPAIVIRRRHPPLVIPRLLSWHNLPPNLVPCRSPHPPLSWHCPPPRHLTHYIIRRPPSAQRYRRHSHRCNPLLTPTTLIAPSTSYCLLLSRCPLAAAIVAATFSSLRPVLSRLPPPALVAPSQRQCNNIAPAIVTVTS